jgi:hypothetical protein
MTPTEQERLGIAVHEASHACIAEALDDVD